MSMKCSRPSKTVGSYNSSLTTKTVNFYPQALVIDTISHRDMTHKEHCDCWFQDHEYRVMHQRNSEIVKSFEESQGQVRDTAMNTSLDTEIEDDLCLRGLEIRLRSQRKRRLSVRSLAMDKVLIEQEDQYCFGSQYLYGIYDDDAIARVYKEANHECRFHAECRAMIDRREIEDYLGLKTTNDIVLVRERRSSRAAIPMVC